MVVAVPQRQLTFRLRLPRSSRRTSPLPLPLPLPLLNFRCCRRKRICRKCLQLHRLRHHGHGLCTLFEATDRRHYDSSLWQPIGGSDLKHVHSLIIALLHAS